MERRVRVHTDATLTISSDRHRTHPWGVGGGLSAAGSCVRLAKASGETIELPGKITCDIQAGDQLTTITPGGGGWGDPTQRSRHAVDQDLCERMISPARARAVYGYGGTAEVDAAQQPHTVPGEGGLADH